VRFDFDTETGDHSNLVGVNPDGTTYELDDLVREDLEESIDHNHNDLMNGTL
jgi:hypothetical protein